MGNLLPELTGPVQLEFTKAIEQLSGEHGMPGGSRYELKWDGSFTELVKPGQLSEPQQQTERLVT